MKIFVRTKLLKLFSNMEEHIKYDEKIRELNKNEGCILRIDDKLDQNQNSFDPFSYKQ